MLDHRGFWPWIIPRRSKKSECLHMTETSIIPSKLAIYFNLGIRLLASLDSVRIRRCGFVEMSSNDDCRSVLQFIKHRHTLTFYRQHQYIALKVYIHSSRTNREIKVLEHLSNIKTDHPGRGSVRTMLDNFEVTGTKGTCQCVVHEPLLTSVLHFQAGLDPPSLPEDLLKGLLQQVLLALDYLHTEANVTHTGLSPLKITILHGMQRRTKLTLIFRHTGQNIIVSASENSIFRDWEKSERRAMSTESYTRSSNYLPKPHIPEPAGLAQLRNAYTI